MIDENTFSEFIINNIELQYYRELLVEAQKRGDFATSCDLLTMVNVKKFQSLRLKVLLIEFTNCN